MASITRLKIICSVFLVLQIAFSMLSRELFNLENVFPMFNWKIFHTRPDKYWSRHFILIHRIDDLSLDEPKDILDLQEKFPGIFFYTFNRKIKKLGVDFHTKKRQVHLNIINENLLKDYKNVDWELVEYRFDIIDFYKSKSIVSKKSLGRYVAIE